MKKNVRLYLPLILAALSTPLSAQKLTASRHEIDVKNWNLMKDGDSLYISFRLLSDKMDISSNKSLHLVPMLVKGDSVHEMTPVIVAGRRQYIASQRRNDYGMLVRNGNDSISIAYRTSVPYCKWMNTADVVLSFDECGCGGDPYSHDNVLLNKVRLEVPPFRFSPVMAFAVPEVEAVKHREESGRAFLDFPVNQTVIYPEYRNNVAELYKIMSTIDVVRNDTNTVITSISIHGYASPEGSYANNARLAKGRAEALKKYVCTQYGFADTLFTVKSTPEDWEGLREFVSSSSIDLRDKVLEIIDSKYPEDEKNHMLEKIDGRKTYTYLLNNVYPSLRHSDYTVNYTVRPFNVEEAARVLRVRPQLLSLNEMYMVANLYKAGSKEFNEVFDIAVRMYPDDETANLNAANIHLSEGDWQKAERYLQKAGNSPKATIARGVYAMLKGDYTQAKELLMKVSMEGFREAEMNLEQLEQKLEYDKYNK